MVSIPFDRGWERLVAAGALVTAIGSIPPWVTMSVDQAVVDSDAVSVAATTTRGGITGDGFLTLLFAAVAVGLLWRATVLDLAASSWKRGLFVFLSGALCLVTVGVTYRDPQVFAAQLDSLRDAGVISAGSAALTIEYHMAMWVALLGGIAVTIGGALSIIDGLNLFGGTGSDPYPESP